jgi:predicted RNA binding protein YcfA (HicA-like mRNA interferase family)
MLNYAETLKLMEAEGWERVHESNTHIFFVKRLSDGSFARNAVEYKR